MSADQQSATVKLINNLYAAVDLTKDAISDFARCLEDNVEDQGVFKCYDTFVKLSCDYVNALEDLGSILNVNLNWLPFDKPPDTSGEAPGTGIFPSPQINISYADGQTPWSFWLAYEPSPEFKSLLSALHTEWCEGKLKPIGEMPPVGSFVVCCDRNIVFRGIVLSNKLDKARVRNIDDTVIKVVKLDKMFSLSRKWRSIHAQTVQCCLTKDESLIKIWNSDLAELFKNTLKEAKLSVKFIEECADCIPAKFFVALKTEGRVVADLNSWICERIFPELVGYQDRPESLTLEELPESVVDPYCTEERDPSRRGVYHRGIKMIQYSDEQFDEGMNRGEDRNAGRRWAAELYEPSNQLLTSYYMTQGPGGPPVFPVHQIIGFANAIASQCSQDSSNVFQVPPRLMSTGGFVVNPVALANSTLNVNTPVFEPRKKSEITVTELRDDTQKATVVKCDPVNSEDVGNPATPKPSSPTLVKQCPSADQADICPMFLKSGFCLLPACSKKHVKTESLPNKACNQTAQVKEQDSVLKNEPVPSTKVHTKKNDLDAIIETSTNSSPLGNLSAQNLNTRQDDNLYSEDDDDLEEPCITGGYMPKDESRLCRFPSKNGRCWKIQCDREHEDSNQNKWTTDKQTTLMSAFNMLNLPKCGETIELLVTHVRSPSTFYARLPDIYSDIGEGVVNFETFRSLHRSLNDPKNIKGYVSLSGISPAGGELCLARGGRDRLWKRALVVEPSARYITVFYVDYGDEERVPVSDLRLIEDRFNHLPAQAILCTLSGLFCDTDDLELRIRGKKFLAEQIKGQVIIGKVIDRGTDESLDLVVSYNNLNMNKLMVCKGFCELIRSNSPSSML